MFVELGLRAHDHWRLRRFRQAYAEISGHRSSTPGYAGLIEEMRWALEHLDASTRERADEQVLRGIFYGALALAALRRLGAHEPQRLARCMAAVAPVALRFLVGELEVVVGQPGVNHLPDCRFRGEGGESLCREVCQRPSEAFTRTHGIPVVLEPQPDGACRWTWGQARTP